MRPSPPDSIDETQPKITPFDANVPVETNASSEAERAAAPPNTAAPLPSYADDLGLAPGKHNVTAVREPVAPPEPAAAFYETNPRAERRADRRSDAVPVLPTPTVADIVAPGTLPIAHFGDANASASTRITRRAQFLESIDIASAFRIGALVSAFTWSILGLFVVVLPAILGVSLAGMMRVGGASGVAEGRDIGAAFLAYLFTIILGSIVTGAACGLAAWGYNIVAASLGGLEMEVTQSDVT